MLSANQIKHIKSLQQKKFRQIHKEFVAEGPKIVSELIKSSFKINKVLYLESLLNQFEKPATHSVEIISKKELDRISGLKTPSGILAVFEIPEQTSFRPDDIDDIVLVLDGIQDPGNMGTIIRTADWFGIKNIVCSQDTVEVFNPKVVQASMGSIARVTVFYQELITILSGAKNKIRVYGTLLEGEDIYSLKLESNSFIVIGNESKGISREVQKFITDRIKIPEYSKGRDTRADSLNASIATALICAEFRRQKRN